MMLLRVTAGFQRLVEPSGGIYKHVAYELVRRSVVWLTHPMGETKAPGHADNIVGAHGHWCIRLGANALDVTQAVLNIRACTLDWASKIVAEPTAKEWNDLYTKNVLCVRRSVRNSQGELYSLYPVDPGTARMIFGANAIDVHDFLRELEFLSKIKESALHAKPHTPATPTTATNSPQPQAQCPLCGVKVRADRMARHKQERCPRNQRSG